MAETRRLIEDGFTVPVGMQARRSDIPVDFETFQALRLQQVVHNEVSVTIGGDQVEFKEGKGPKARLIECLPSFRGDAELKAGTVERMETVSDKIADKVIEKLRGDPEFLARGDRLRFSATLNLKPNELIFFGQSEKSSGDGLQRVLDSYRAMEITAGSPEGATRFFENMSPGEDGIPKTREDWLMATLRRAEVKVGKELIRQLKVEGSVGELNLVDRETMEPDAKPIRWEIENREELSDACRLNRGMSIMPRYLDDGSLEFDVTMVLDSARAGKPINLTSIGWKPTQETPGAGAA